MFTALLWVWAEYLGGPSLTRWLYWYLRVVPRRPAALAEARGGFYAEQEPPPAGARGRERDGAGMAAGTAAGAAQELRTLLHRLGNQVATASGYAQLLSLAPELPPAAQCQVAQLGAATMAACHTLEQMRAVLNRQSERGSEVEPPSPA